MEASRRHGSFDMRWPCARIDRSGGAERTGSNANAEEAANGLEWDAFSDRYFRGRRRHDSEAQSAYAAYRQGREWRRSPARLSLVPAENGSAADLEEGEEAGTRRLMAAMASGLPADDS
jgi:hypothetical protein